MSSLTSVLQENFLEVRIPFLAPSALGSKHAFHMLSLLAKSLPDKVVDQKSTFVLSLKLILS